MEKDDSSRSWAKGLALFVVIIETLIGYNAVGIGAGWFAWKRWGAPWWVILVTALVALTLSMHRLYQLSQKDWDEEK